MSSHIESYAAQGSLRAMDPAALRNRLVMATSMWREATDDPLPRMAPGRSRRSRSRSSSSRWSSCSSRTATPETARQTANKTWDLVHDRPDDDPVKQRVVKGHEELARSVAAARRRAGAPAGGMSEAAGGRLAVQPPRQGPGARPTCSWRAARSARSPWSCRTTRTIDDGPLFALTALARRHRRWCCSPARTRCRARACTSLVAVATLMLGVANYFVGTTVLYPILYCWTALYAFTFFALRAALLQMALIGVSYAIVLVAQDAPSPVTRWLLVVGTPLVIGVLISNLLERLRAPGAPGRAALCRAGGVRGPHARDRGGRTRRVRHDRARRHRAAVEPRGGAAVRRSARRRRSGATWPS